MSYTQRNLTPGEKIIYITRITSFVFYPWLILSLLGAGSLLFVEYLSIPFYAAAIVSALCFLRMLPRLFYYLSSEFSITNRRVLGKIGIASISSVDILLAKVESVRIQQDFVGQLFNYGDLEVTGTGGTKERLMLLARPIAFRNKLEEALGDLSGRDATGKDD